jgi:hypothetical protein
LKSIEKREAFQMLSDSATVTSPRKPIAHFAIVALAFTVLALDCRRHTVLAQRRDFLPMRAGHSTQGRTNNLPGIIFWAWERPEDLRFLNPGQDGVAFLAKTIYLPSPGVAPRETSTAEFIVRPRLQPLRIAPGTTLIAVARIETPPLHAPVSTTPAISPETRERIASEIAALQNIPAVSAIQIDFDATSSQHAFYSTLLQVVRRKLAPAIPLSITALASWCIGDRWLDQLPPDTIDEAVPMLFRMGPDSASVARFLRAGEEFPVAACRDTLGLSTDEQVSHDLLTRRFAGMPAAWRQKRIYIFAPHAWTASAANSILQEWQP